MRVIAVGWVVRARCRQRVEASGRSAVSRWWSSGERAAREEPPMSTSRTLRLTASFFAVAASLALAGSMTVSAAADANHLGTDHLAQAPARAAGLDASGISQVTGAQFDIGAVV